MGHSHIYMCVCVCVCVYVCVCVRMEIKMQDIESFENCKKEYCKEVTIIHFIEKTTI